MCVMDVRGTGEYRLGRRSNGTDGNGCHSCSCEAAHG
jgi:hypothetical protein